MQAAPVQQPQPMFQVPSHSLANAARTLNNHLSTGLGQTHNLGYESLTMDHLRRDPRNTAAADILLQQEVQNVAPLNPLLSVAASPGRSNQESTVDQLYAATVRNRQLKGILSC